MRRAFSAPGKLFLSGEYAVLWGGVARVLAVAPRGNALVVRREDREVQLHLSEGRLQGTLTPYGVQWRSEIAPAFRFAARAIDAAVAAHGQEVLGFSLALSPSTEKVEGRKMGIGGSARAVMLTTEAVRYVLEARFDALKLALWAHADAQGKVGSGGDVAASFAGGVIRYRRYPVETLQQPASRFGEAPVGSSTALGSTTLSAAPPVDLRRLQLPALHLTYAFAGQSASTEKLIGRVEEKLDETERWKFAARSDAIGDALENALLMGNFSDVREAVSELHTLLCSLGPLETDGIRQLVALARTLGSVAKISGAGGGDGCIAFSPTAEAQADLIEGFKTRNIWATRLEPAPGLRGENEADPQLTGWIGPVAGA
jgi:phosphomevalonate kinase